MKKERIFKTPKIGRIFKAASIYLGKYITRQPLVFNLNLNVTNLCNQNCPMCNAVIVGKGKGVTITLDQVRNYLEILKPYKIASLTISGGEPSIVKDIPSILEYCAPMFPFGINVNSNLYAQESVISRFAEAALRNNIRIGTSFDGIGIVADRLRGARDVSKRVLASIEMVTRMKADMKSLSTLNMHTVISDQNIDQVPDILAISEKYGWTHTLAPVNNFFYQDCDDSNTPTLQYSEKLERLIELASRKKNIAVSRDFLLSIPRFAKGDFDKLCPYLTGIFRTYKIFLDPNGDLSLCSRVPVGNINQTSISNMLTSDLYNKDMASYMKCPGCWMACFVEIILAMPKFYQKRIMSKYL
jgi:MoaA/NifB/PqqE/SkfB family radical SAM enzyme